MTLYNIHERTFRRETYRGLPAIQQYCQKQAANKKVITPHQNLSIFRYA